MCPAHSVPSRHAWWRVASSLAPGILSGPAVLCQRSDGCLEATVDVLRNGVWAMSMPGAGGSSCEDPLRVRAAHPGERLLVGF